MSVISYLSGLLSANTQLETFPFSTLLTDLAAEGIGGPIAGAPDIATAASLTTDLTGDNNDLVWTAKVAGVAGEEITVEYVDPGVDCEIEAIAVVGEAIKVTLGTDNGDKASATLTEGIVVERDDAGSAGNVGNVVVRLPKLSLGNIATEAHPDFPKPSASLAASKVDDDVDVCLGTNAGTCASLTVTESSGSLGQITIAAKAAYAGTWMNDVKFRILRAESANLFEVQFAIDEEDDIPYFWVSLEVDANYDVTPITDDALAIAINSYLATVYLDVEETIPLSDVFLATSSSAGSFDTSSEWTNFTGGVDAAADNAKNTSVLVTAAIHALDGISATVATDPVSTIETIPFADGGANYAFTTTGDSIKALVTGNAVVASLVTCVDAAANDGTGLVYALAETPLAGGVDGTVGAAGVVRYDAMALYIATEECTTTESHWATLVYDL